MVALDFLVPQRLVLFAPDALPVRRQVGREDVLRPFRRVGIFLGTEPVVSRTINIMIACHEKFLDPMPARRHSARKELVPVICVVLHFLNLPAMGEVAAMDYSIDVSGGEILHRGGKVFRRPVAPRTHTLDGSPEVRVAQDAEHEIRGLFRLPSLRRDKKDAAGQRGEPQRREHSLQKFSSVHFQKNFTVCKYHFSFSLLLLSANC